MAGTAESVSVAVDPGSGFPRLRRFWYYLWPSHVTGVVGAFIGYFTASAITGLLVGTTGYQADQNLLSGFVGLVLGWLVGLSAVKLPLQWVVGVAEPNSRHEQARLTYAEDGWWRYFRFNTDHKVIGIQYLALVLFMLSNGGLLAMLIRLDLIHPGNPLVDTDAYNTLVTMHGMRAACPRWGSWWRPSWAAP